jgi:hypothetical protein
MIEKLTEKALRDMIDGCNGVTPGPWAANGISSEGLVWLLSYSHWIASTNLTPVRSDLVKVNAAYLSRCDPDTVRSIITELLELALELLTAHGQAIERTEA